MATSMRPDEYAGPVLVSVGLHVFVVLAMLMNLSRCDQELVLPQVPEHVRAVVVERQSYRPPAPRPLPQIEIPDIVVPPKPEPLKPEPLKEAPVKPAPKVAEKGIAKPDPAKPVVQERKPPLPAPDFSDLLAQEDKVKAQRDAQQREAAEKAEREESARAAQNQKAVNDYMALMAAEIERRWIPPPSGSEGLKTVLRISLLPGGEVQAVQLLKSSGDASFDKSAENAVRLAGRLPVPSDPALFGQFRRFTFTFDPKERKR